MLVGFIIILFQNSKANINLKASVYNIMNDERTIEYLKLKLLNSQIFNEWYVRQQRRFLEQQKKHKDYNQEAQQIQHLDIQDYLSLYANQKKNLTFNRYLKLKKINNSLTIPQQSYRNMFAIASQSNYRRLQHPGYYKELLKLVDQYPIYFFNAIDKDIHRTFLNSHPFQISLREVLTAYAIRNPSLVYCQGMNYIVAFLLINQMSSQQAFWFMTCLVENILPDDYFKDLTTISIIICIINQLMEEIFPDFKQEMMEVGMECSIFIVPWFVCLFTKGFINSVSAFLLNYILLQSRHYRISYVLLKISLALLDILISKQEAYRYSKDFKTFKDFLDTKFFEISLSQIQEGIEDIKLNYQVYVQMQDYYRQEKRQNRNEHLKNRNKKLSLPPCNKNYPICFHRIQMQKKAGFIENALILKQGINLRDHFIEDYLETEICSKQSKTINYNNINQCLIGRHQHICHLNQQEYKTKHTKFQREQTIKIELMPDNQENLQEKLEYTTVQDRFKEVSQFFIVDQNYQDQQNVEQEFKKEIEEFSIEKHLSERQKRPKSQKIIQSPTRPQKHTFYDMTIGKVFRKVGEKLTQFKNIKARKSQSSIKVENLQSVNI